MPKSKVEGRLVTVDELPERSRRGKYVRVLEEFMAGDAKCANFETTSEPDGVAVAMCGRPQARRRRERHLRRGLSREEVMPQTNPMSRADSRGHTDLHADSGRHRAS